MPHLTTAERIGRKIGIREGRKEGRKLEREEEREEVARTLLLLLGRKRFSEPDADTHAAIEAIRSHEALEQLIQRLLDAESWQDLIH